MLNLKAFKKVVKKATFRTATIHQKTVYQLLNTLNNFDSAALNLYAKTYNIYSNIKTQALYFQEIRKHEANEVEYVYTNHLTYHFLALQIDLVEAYCWNMPQVKTINWEKFKHF